MKNKLLGLSLITVTCLYGLLAAIIILVCILTGADVLIGIIVSLVILLIQFLVSPWLTDLTMKWFYGVKWNPVLPEYLMKFLNEECSKLKIKMPKIGFINDGGPNAFTYGRGRNDARIIFTRGIVELLSEEEVKAVICHELGHVEHRDMMVMTFAQVVPLVLYGIYEAFTRSNNSNNNDNKAAIIGYIAYILYVISQYIILWLSRTREYYADSFAIEETKNPTALAESLVKIGFGLSTNKTTSKHDVSKNNALGIFDTKTSKTMVVTCVDENGSISKNKIKNAMKWEMWNPWATWFELNSTHPLISKRLLAISKRCKEFMQDEYVVFDLIKTESYVDDFFLEVLIKFSPILAIIMTVILCFVLENNIFTVISLGIFATLVFALIGYMRSHKNSNYTESNVENLLGEVKVSHITSIPCVLKGNIIGRGNPGCIFNEDFILKDQTGIIFLDYNQPLNVLNKIFALFKSPEYFDKEVVVKGWYRRNPVPYVEIKEMTVNGKTKKIHTYTIGKVLYFIGISVSLIAGIISLFM